MCFGAFHIAHVNDLFTTLVICAITSCNCWILAVSGHAALMSPKNSRYASINRHAPLVHIEEDDGRPTSGDALIDIDGLAAGLIEARSPGGVRPYNDWPNDLGVS